ncbi:beta-ketoacyl-ACP synthase III [Christensenella minuta]|uniref:3-oxoacyl-ACP synthase III family protein n=1 Tax=Christensenella minuta TaxID=626937 RepID=UPI002A7FD0B1|nr:beta-ketoacyl-ACP synthase III [Christensenella minuta]MDY3752499.1 beta-ketoacyl-ACP synthase III [Christensenella minuta]
MSIHIMGTGSYLPEKVMTNEDFEKIIDTSDEWITKRTGIKRRHYVENGMWNKDMCFIAANIAMKEAGITKDDLGGIIVASVTNEMGVPSVASQIQRELEIPEAVCFDVNSACTGFMFALKAAEGLLRPGGKPFLVCGSETLSRFMNMEDRASCILFGDGAGAVVIEHGAGMKYFEVYSKPDTDGLITINGMNTLKDGVVQPSYAALKGREVYVFATREAERVIRLGLEGSGKTPEEIDWFLMHQSNYRITKTIAQRLGMPMDKFYSNIDDTSNTSAASIPIALDQMNKKGMLKKGDKLVIAGFGGGLSSGCAVYEW